MHSALFIGRFQPFHKAHLIDIKEILKEADEVLIAIGSSQEKSTLENPFSYNERKRMIEKALKNNKIENYKIFPIPDISSDEEWVDYIKKNLPSYDFVYSGNPWTLKCFKRHDFNVKKIKLIKGISSTIVRVMIVKNKDWKKLVPKEIADSIEKIKGVKRIKKLY